MLNKGDKIELVAPMGLFTNIGEICEVMDIGGDGLIWFKFGNGMHIGCMSPDEFDKYFKKYEEPEDTLAVDDEYVDWLIENSEINVITAHGKCTVVTCQLPSGFVIVESSSCVDPKNYDKNLGVEICMKRIKDKIYELEAYHLQQTLWVDEDGDCDFFCDCSCDECECEREYDECLDTDLDCDDCDNYDCQFNTRS